jgi:hypothetical protein
MRKLIGLFAFSVAAGILGGCTGSGSAHFLPQGASAHAVHVQDVNGGIIDGGGDGGDGQ